METHYARNAHLLGGRKMRIAIAADHAGFSMKEDLKAYLQELGHDVNDLGTHDTQPVDYPKFAELVGLEILNKKADRGILVCGSGVGVSVAANKIPGVRCGVCHDHYSAHQSVEHDDVNVLALGNRVIGPAEARDLVKAFTDARFTGEERHRRRLEMVKELENKYSRILVSKNADQA